MKTVLIIQDKKDQNSYIQEMLNHSDFKIYFTCGKNDGLEIAARYLPDLIVCDFDDQTMYPDLLKSLQFNPAAASIPVLIVISDLVNTDINRLFCSGADNCIIKPFTSAELLRIIESRFKKISLLKEKFSDPFVDSLDGSNGTKKRNDHILVKLGAKLKLVEYSKIEMITALKEYSQIVTEDKVKIVVRKSLKQWLEVLPPKDFLRIHRATIINIHYLEKIEKTGLRTYTVHLKNISESFSLSQRFANIMRRSFPS